jgi:DNA adenine methylase
MGPVNSAWRVAVLPASDSSGRILRPFLRWAGGKQRLVRHLLQYTPEPTSFNTYYEPFLGAGSLFFALKPQKSILGDINLELINCYAQIAASPTTISNLLMKYERRHSREFFYKIRSIPTDEMTAIERVARFIYLNKAGFNGIYRVNLQGIFNVPYGPTIAGLSLPKPAALVEIGGRLQQTTLRAIDFAECVRDARKGDFVYLDPPYPPQSETAFFTHYSSERFGWEQQKRVADAFECLSNRGCLVMLSNADQKEVVSLFKGFRISRLDTLRWLGSNGDRFAVREIVVTNYRLKKGRA